MRLGRFGRQAERANRQRERVAWTLVGMVGIDPGKAVAAGWLGPHLKDEGCLPSPRAALSLSLSLVLQLSVYLSYLSFSYSFADDRTKRSEGEKKRDAELRDHVSGVLTSQKIETEIDYSEHPCTKDVIFFLFLM